MACEVGGDGDENGHHGGNGGMKMWSECLSWLLDIVSVREQEMKILHESAATGYRYSQYRMQHVRFPGQFRPSMTDT